MPDCRNCSYFDGKCTVNSRLFPGSKIPRLRWCVWAIMHEYCQLISSGKRVLEIGCGGNTLIRDRCTAVGAQWEAVDTQEYYMNAPTIATRIESVENLSFPDEYFDFIIGTQTLEHWSESGCKPELGLWQCFRTCKIGGSVLMNVPIHFHGSRIFVEGKLDAIKNLFVLFTEDVVAELWARDSSPMPPLQDIPLRFQKFEQPSVFQMDIRAKRTGELPARPRGYLFSSRIVREIMDHRFSYLFWKGWRKAKNLIQ
jgi:SAM-dependent methyltransferase